MGGKALKIAETKRANRDEYFEIANDVSTILDTYGIQYEIPKSYENKESFGDLDVLILKKNIDDLNKIIEECFHPTEVYHNDSIHSFDFKKLQIDFIEVEPENWEPSIVYFSYNDLGNLIGRIAVKLGLRYGHYGLKYTYIHEDGGNKDSMIISDDPKKIFEFLGFDWDRYLEGFTDLEDIFKYVVESKYFCSTLFRYESLDHRNRTRNKKRVNYQKFLQYIGEQPNGDECKDIDNKTIFVESTYPFKSKEYYLDKAESFFNVDITSNVYQWVNNQRLIKLSRKKINGTAFNLLYGLEKMI